MNYTLNDLMHADGNIKYFNKLKMEIKATKILYASNSFYGWQPRYVFYERYLKDYQKLIVKRPKKMIHLKLIPAALSLHNNKIKYYFNNMSVNNLHLDVYLYGGEFMFFNESIATSKMELTKLTDTLKNINIKTLTINLSYESFRNFTLDLSNMRRLEYIRQIQYLRQHIQKYCNDMQVEIYFHGDHYECDFWNNPECTNYSSKTFIMLYGHLSYKWKNIHWGMIDKTKPNFHRNFKLDNRIIKKNYY